MLKCGPDKPELGPICVVSWDGGVIEGGTFQAYDLNVQQPLFWSIKSLIYQGAFKLTTIQE